MKNQRLVRVNELIRREIAASLPRFVHGIDVDLGAVTITRVATASNLRTARVWVSVSRDREKVTRVLALLLDRRCDIQAHLGHTLKIKYTPRLFFEQDVSLEQGDRMLALLDDLADETHVGPELPPSETEKTEDD